MFWLVVLAVVVVLVLFVVGIYNSLIQKRNAVSNEFSGIDVVLNKRYDLIPNLVEVAKKYLQHEQDTLVKVTQARNAAVSALKNVSQNNAADNVQALSQAEQQLGSALGNLQVVFEDYPELKADAQLLNLQAELSGIENELAFARQGYNATVTEYNNSLQVFPNNVVALFFHFQAASWLQVEDAKVREAVRVQF